MDKSAVIMELQESGENVQHIYILKQFKYN